jgi:hypothetical protein
MSRGRVRLASCIGALALFLLAATRLDSAPRPDPEVMALIDRLSSIEDGGAMGVTPWASVSQFLPVGSMRRMEAGILGTVVEDPALDPDLVQLVAWGPRAIPALLARLTDATPTQFVVEHGGGFGAMWYGVELDAEPRTLAAHPGVGPPGSAWGEMDATIRRHVITVGDVCMFALGQIVNRDYAPTRYQPTACIVVRSPSRDPILADVVREIWGGPDVRRRLVASLQRDRMDDSWNSARKAGAMVRLMSFAPEAVIDDVERELRALAAAAAPGPAPAPAPGDDADDDDRSRPQDVLFAAKGLVDRVGFSSDVRITDAILDLVERVPNASLLASAMTEPMLARHGDRLVDLATATLSEPSSVEGRPDRGRQMLLERLGVAAPEVIPALMAIAASHPTVSDRAAVAIALADPRFEGAWTVPLLESLLDDERPSGRDWHAFERRFDLRIRDLAAMAIASRRDDLELFFRIDVADLDQQIDRMRDVLAGRTPAVDAMAAVPLDRVPLSEPTSAHVLDLVVSVIDADTDGSLRALGGLPEPDSYRIRRSVFDVDGASGHVTQGHALPPLPGYDTWVGALDRRRVVLFDGDDSGDLLVFDADAGRELRRIPTPFHSDWDRKDRWRVGTGIIFLFKELQCVAICGADGMLHRIDLRTGERTTLEGPPEDDLVFRDWQPTRIEGTSRILLRGGSAFDPEHRVWDVATGIVSPGAEFPSSGVGAMAGRYAITRVNDGLTVWDLADGAAVPVPLRLEPGVRLGSSVVGSRRLDPERRLLHAIVYDAETLRGSSVVTLDLRTGLPIARFEVPAEPRRSASLTLLRGGSLLAWTESRSERDEENRIVDPRTAVAILDIDALEGRPWIGGAGH